MSDPGILRTGAALHAADRPVRDDNDVELTWDRPPHEWPPYDSAEFIGASMAVDSLITLA